MFDVIVVGGGIGGAVLARLLGRGKRRVLVLERGLPAQSSNRPEVLWPHTVQFLSSLIPPGDNWLLPLEGLQAWLGERQLGEVRTDVFAEPRRGPTSSAPHETRRLLLEAAECEVLHGYEVEHVLKQGDVVRGVAARRLSDGNEEQWESHLVVGDDGTHSVIRQQCGIALKPTVVMLQLLSFGLALPAGFPPATVQVWVNQQRAKSGIILCGCIPLPGNRAAALVAMRPRAFASDSAVNEGLATFSTQHPRLAEVLGGRTYPDGIFRLTLQYGNASRYLAPGVALIGDAAHPVTPAGGQGANLAIADARCLAACLLAPGEPQLKQYEQLRRKAANRSLRFSRGAALAFSLPEFLTNSLLPTTLRLATRLPHLFGQALLNQASRAFQ